MCCCGRCCIQVPVVFQCSALLIRRIRPLAEEVIHIYNSVKKSLPFRKWLLVDALTGVGVTAFANSYPESGDLKAILLEVGGDAKAL